MDGLLAQVPQFREILRLNVILSGDNAVVIGLAAAGLPEKLRAKAVLFGILAAAVLRVVFSIFATFRLTLWWIDIVGGLALFCITWGFCGELRGGEDEEEHGGKHREKTLMQALCQIIIADVSMSLDNVLAVAAVARSTLPMLVVGLLVSMILMGLLGGRAGAVAGPLQMDRVDRAGADRLYRRGAAVGVAGDGQCHPAARPAPAGAPRGRSH